ncbi:hypothetical protein Ddye_024359 [Dipteronia dyeriana]|uniref:Pyrimidine 5-nucleotidase n=1 Tax=Dipteronia dyeriana TaxID=168575 RepID=A0AAD9TUV3_9ROSI|nr:hypothetical protein Ddye_024359 [Dipteronia dyeriana]
MEYQNQYQDAPETKYECLLFDVDDTLYSQSSGLSKQCTKNIEEYMIEKLGMEESSASELNMVLYRNYGTSMAGLKAIGYEFDNDDYHSYVHGRLPYENLKPDPVLRNLLLSMPIRKVIFSNADKVHVAKVLKKLGLEDCFEGIVNFESLNPENTSNSDDGHEPKDLLCRSGSNTEIVAGDSQLLKTPILCKPFEDAFEQAFNIANINPQKTLFFDDSTRNIETGKNMGLHTVLVGKSHRTNGADYALESIHNIREALPELFCTDHKRSKSIKYSEKVAIETSVRA